MIKAAVLTGLAVRERLERLVVTLRLTAPLTVAARIGAARASASGFGMAPNLAVGDPAGC